MKLSASIVVGFYLSELEARSVVSFVLDEYTVFRNVDDSSKDILGLPIISTTASEPLKLSCFRHDMASLKDKIKKDFNIEADVHLLNS